MSVYNLSPLAYSGRYTDIQKPLRLDLTHIITMGKRFFSCDVFIDLKQAFDTVDHKILLNNFFFYKQTGQTLTLLTILTLYLNLH